jgi:hypothetical protein
MEAPHGLAAILRDTRAGQPKRAAGKRAPQDEVGNNFTGSKVGKLERAKGIEPLYAAWKTAVLPLNYARDIVCRIAAMGLVTQPHNSFTEACRDIPRTAFGTNFQVFKNSFPIRERREDKPNPHRPWRLSASATSSSDTNSPRSACARPLFTEIRSSSDIVWIPVRRASISHAYSANSSWSSRDHLVSGGEECVRYLQAKRTSEVRRA